MEKRCARCFQSGHLIGECTNEIVFLYCKKTGHTQSGCSKKSADYPSLKKNENANKISAKTHKKQKETPIEKPITNQTVTIAQLEDKEKGIEPESKESEDNAWKNILQLSSDGSESDSDPEKNPPTRTESKPESHDCIYSKEEKMKILSRWKTVTPKKKRRSRPNTPRAWNKLGNDTNKNLAVRQPMPNLIEE